MQFKIPPLGTIIQLVGVAIWALAAFAHFFTQPGDATNVLPVWHALLLGLACYAGGPIIGGLVSKPPTP